MAARTHHGMKTLRFNSHGPARWVVGLVAAAMVALAACGSPESSTGTEVRGDADYAPVALAEAGATDDVVAATLDLGLHLAADSADENLVVSPASVAVTLALVAEGADGETLEALDAVLGATGPDRAEAFSALQAAVLEYGGDPQIVQDEELPERPMVHLANGLMLDEQAEIGREYLDAITGAFDTGVLTTDFAGGDGKEELDAWVAEHTGGLIEESAINPTEDTVFVIQNAVLLAAQWQRPFQESETWERPFTTSTGEERQAETMHRASDMAYAEDNGTQAVRLPYTDAFAMDVVLPAVDGDPSELTSTDWEALDEGLSGGPQTEVDLALPKVDFEYTTPLNDQLVALSLDSMFVPGGLDGITPQA